MDKYKHAQLRKIDPIAHISTVEDHFELYVFLLLITLKILEMFFLLQNWAKILADKY